MSPPVAGLVHLPQTSIILQVRLYILDDFERGCPFTEILVKTVGNVRHGPIGTFP